MQAKLAVLALLCWSAHASAASTDTALTVESDSWTLRRSLYLELPWENTSRFDGAPEGTPRGPGPFVVDLKGRVVLADIAGQKLQAFAQGGRLVKEKKIEGGVLIGLAMDREGLLYALLWDHGYKVDVLNPEFEGLRSVPVASARDKEDSAYSGSPGQLTPFDAVEVDAQGRIYVYDDSDMTTRVVDKDGKPLDSFKDDGAYGLLCRGRLRFEVELEGETRTYLNVLTPGGKRLWRSPSISKTFYGCGGGYALVAADSDPTAEVKGPETSLVLIGIEDGSIAELPVRGEGAGEDEGALSGVTGPLGSSGGAMQRWLSPEGTLYLQGRWDADKFRVYKAALSPKKK